jgi:leader peptidase (prepilin peptidase)/N-methyltransferase
MPSSLLPLTWLIPAAIGLGLTTPWLVRSFAADATITSLRSVGALLVAALWAFLTVPSGIVLIATLLLGWVLFLLAVIDAASFRLPNLITLATGLAGLAVTWLVSRDEIVAHIIGAAIGFAVLAGLALLYRRLRGHDGLGLGDAKLAAVAGAWLGWLALPSVILLAAVGGLILYGVAAARSGARTLSDPVPFGIPLGFAIWLVWLYGPLV